MIPMFKRRELLQLADLLGHLLQPGALRHPEMVRDAQELREKVGGLIRSASDATERGKKILEWRVPSELAPTMNAYNFMKGWQKGKVIAELVRRLSPIVESTPDARVYGLTRQRWVRVTRFTPNVSTVDDPNATDTIGGKLLIDRLVDLEVLIDDTPALCRREGCVRPTARGNTHVLVEVFDMADDEQPDAGPLDLPCPKPEKRKRKVRDLVEAATAPAAPEAKRSLPFG